MAVEREDLSFRTGELEDLGIRSTEKIIEQGENFLNSDPDDIVLLSKDTNTHPGPKQKVENTNKQTTNSTQKQPTVKVVTPKSISEDEAFKLMNGESLDEEEEETNEEGDNKGEDEQEEAIVLKKKKNKELTQTGTDNEESEEELALKAKANGQQVSETKETTQEDQEAIYSSIADEMVNQGIFEQEEDEEGNPIKIKTPEELLERFQDVGNRIARQTIDSFLNSKGPEAREIFDNIIVKGVKPQDYINRYAKIQDFKNLDLTDESNQEKVVRELYRSEGRSADYIEKKLTQHKQYNDLATEAEEAQRILVEKSENEVKLLAENKQKEDATKARVRTEYVNNLVKILNEKAKVKEFDGIPLTNEIAQDVFGYLTEEKYRLADSQQLLTEFDKDIMELARPENHPTKIKVALLLKMLQTDPKLSKLSKKAVSKESSELFKGLRQRNSKGGTTKTAPSKEQTETRVEDDKPKSWFN
jgi:hypothetical protein